MSDEKMIRIDNLKLLMRERGWKKADLARALECSDAFAGKLVNGKATFGEKAARSCEQKLGKPRGWFDQVHLGGEYSPESIQEATPSDPPQVGERETIQKQHTSEILSGAVRAYSDTTSIRAPVVVWARLGTDLYKDFSEIEAFDSLPVHENASRQVKWYIVEDDMPRFRIKRGYRVALDPHDCTPPMCQEDEIYLFKTTSGRFFLAEFRSLADGQFEAIPDSGLPLDSMRHKIEVVAKHLGTWK